MLQALIRAGSIDLHATSQRQSETALVYCSLLSMLECPKWQIWLRGKFLTLCFKTHLQCKKKKKKNVVYLFGLATVGS